MTEKVCRTGKDEYNQSMAIQPEKHGFKVILQICMVAMTALTLLVGSVSTVQAQATAEPEYSRARVVEIMGERELESVDAATGFIQEVRLERVDTKEQVVLTVGSEFQPLTMTQRLSAGREVILAKQSLGDGSSQYVVADVYRLPILAWLLFGFLALVVIVASWQGLLSIAGMGVSLLVLSGYIVPQILAGGSPMVISLVGGTMIAALTVYLCHGWSRQSHVALGSIVATLIAVTALSYMSVRLAQLVGLGSEEAYFLQFGQTARVNLQGLLLGGIVLGALGILDDITVAQASTIKQLKAVNKKIGVKELYERGLAVGKDHVASLVNTLVLAYAGANLPLFLLFSVNKQIPFWVTLNNEIIAEEVVRTLVGSIGLVLAVPISTLLAVVVFSRQPARES